MRRLKIKLFALIAAILAACVFYMQRNPVILNSIPGIGVLTEHSTQTENQNSSAEIISENLSGPYEVARVIDGDTLSAYIDGEETTVRFIGVDTPESVNPDETKNTEEGKIASDYTKSLIPAGTSVYLEFGEEPTDKYGRRLAYVYLDADGYEMVQEKLLLEGYAKCMPIKPNTKYQNRFASIEDEAKFSGFGFWGTGFFE